MLELAVVAPVLLLLTFGATDIAAGFAAKLRLQSAASRAIELASSGGLDSDAYNDLAQDAADAADVPVANVAVTSTLLCAGTAQSTTTAICPSGDQISRYVEVKVEGTYDPMFPTLFGSSLWGGSGGVPISGSASVRLQ